MMIFPKRVSIGAVLLTIILASTLFAAMNFFVHKALAQDEQSEWVWTQKNPKPSWWRWDEKYYPAKPVRGGIYRTAASRYIGLMNPNHWPVNDWVSMGNFYEKLILTDGNYRSTVPFLASYWEYKDPVTVIMKLRKGVKFTDGSAFNAEAIKFQIDWIRDKRNGAWSRAWLAPVKSIEVVDEYTVRWKFKKPWAGFLGIMSNVPGYVLSHQGLKNDVILRDLKKAQGQAKRLKRKLAKGGEKAKKKYEKAKADVDRLTPMAEGIVSLDAWGVGSGPWIIEEAKPGNRMKYKRNPNWWFGRSIGHPDMPYMDGVLVTVIPEPSVRLANLKAGKIEALHIDKSQYPLVKDDPNLNVWITPGNHVTSMVFNHAEGPCKDIRVRKAISHAIDRKAIIKGTQFGFGIEASCMYPAIHWTHNPNLKPVKYDPELSKKLLAEAGYAKGLTIRGVMGNDQSSVKLGQAIKSMLAQVGIEWKIRTVDPVSGSDANKNRDYDMAGGGWAWIYDPDLMATGLYHPDGGFNYGRSNNEKAIALIEAGRTETDLVKRQKIYWELEKILYENYEDAWLFWYVGIDANRKVVLGYNREMGMAGQEGYFATHPGWFKDGHN
ncbi:MAG: ABC transporter substrate-binding protein [Deltaproteobacteria bacterium]|nr:ABC transporter substrate-binding protein [Deltaproteobacteria bacterium]MBW2140587.1 ABC transporter substrate-binding protein [Deltaproteobacteria bacterium]MBW2323943.1 ABC transporter substrate-binding protein [Deltaproteobacteria bacterium]